MPRTRTARSALAQDPQEASRFLDIADRHTERLTALVRDLLDLSRIESGRLALRPETVDQGEVAAAAAELFRETAMRKRVRLTVAIPPDLPPVTADRGALTQVVTNEVAQGGAVTLPGLGKFACRSRPERLVRNPSTGEQMKKPADRVAKVTIAKQLKDVINA